MATHIMLVVDPDDAQPVRRDGTPAFGDDPGSGVQCLHRVSRGPARVAVVTDGVAGGPVSFAHDTGGASPATAGLALHPETVERFGDTLRDTDALRCTGVEHGCVRIRIEEDGRRGRVENDGMGTIPLYHGTGAAGELCVSTDLEWIMGRMGEVHWDRQAVVEYLAYLHPLEDRTLARGILLFPPGGCLEWCAGEPPRIASRPAFVFESTPSADSGASLVEGFRTAWQSTMRELAARCRSPVLSLSGGLDSRVIAEGLKAEDVFPTCVTFGNPGAAEVYCAQRVAEALGFEHETLPADGHRFPDADAFFRHAGGVGSLFEIYPLWYVPDITAIGESFIQGVTGDIFWGSNGFGCYFTAMDRVMNSLRRDLLRAREAWVLPLVAEDMRAESSDMLYEGLRTSLAPFDAMHPADAATCWNVYNRQRRWGQGSGQIMRQSGHGCENPFFYGPFLEFARKLGPRHRQGGRLYLQIVKTLFPETSGIPRSNDGRAPRDMRGGLYYVRGGIPRRVVNRLKDILDRVRPYPLPGDRTVYRHTAWLADDTRYRAHTLALLEAAVADLPAFLDPRPFSQALVSLRKRVVDFDPLVLGRGLCLAAWHRRWMKGSTA